VSTSHINALELLALQNQLLLTIGGSMNGREVMHGFMDVAVKQLKLQSIHLFTPGGSAYDGTELKPYLSLPDNKLITVENAVVDKMLDKSLDSGISTCLSELVDDRELLGFVFGARGVLLFEMGRGKLQETIKEMLLPVVSRLAEYFYLCEKQRRLSDEVRLNKETQKTYELQAKRDPLTNLPNRREFRYSLSRDISQAQRYGHFGALMYIDLDNFKNVNDSLGHSIGDILLTQVAQRLTAQARSGDSVFRIGGDEFVYILTNVGETEASAISASQTVANRVIDILAKPIEIGGFSLHITPSIGIAVFPDEYGDANDSEHVLKSADTAMYRAKELGRNCYEFFNPEMHVEASKRLIIEDHLRKALANNELSMAYQPIVNIKGEIIGAESLVRWYNPTLGHVPPGDFIGIAEESNLILGLSQWITEHVCSYAETVYEALPADSAFKYISINISPRQFRQEDFVDKTAAIVDNCKVPNDFIKLEFTENVLLDNFEATVEKMEKLRDNNIDFLLDDFGTGYSSLSYLHKLPICLLKIDKSFITDFHTEHEDKSAIVSAIMVMAEQLGINCIIEGVELEEHAEYFRQKEVYGIQGYFYHRPMRGDQMQALLKG